MYAGHLGLGLAASGRRPDVPLGAFLVASVAPDLLVASTFHTIPAVLLLTLAGYALGRWRFDHEVGLLLALLVGLHVAVDLVTSELALWPNGPGLGLRLYDVPAADFVLEAATVAGGWWLWRRSVPPTDRERSPSMLTLLLACQLVFAVFIASGANG